MKRLIACCLLLVGIAYAAPVRWAYDRDGSVQITGPVCDADKELVDDLRHEVERLNATLRGYRAMARARKIKR